MRTSLFNKIDTSSDFYDEVNRASKTGITLKTLFLLLLTVVPAAMVYLFLPKFLENDQLLAFYGLLIGSSIIALICGIAGRFDTRATKYLAVAYALAEGIGLGFITRLVEFYVPGAGLMAVGGTLLIFAVVFALYSFGVLKPSNKLFGIVMALFIGALLLSIAQLIVYFTVADAKTYLYIGVIISIVLLIEGTLSLTFNFAEADLVVNKGCSKNSEWCVALGLAISVIFIYIEILRIILYVAELNRN